MRHKKFFLSIFFTWWNMNFVWRHSGPSEDLTPHPLLDFAIVMGMIPNPSWDRVNLSAKILVPWPPLRRPAPPPFSYSLYQEHMWNTCQQFCVVFFLWGSKSTSCEENIFIAFISTVWTTKRVIFGSPLGSIVFRFLFQSSIISHETLRAKVWDHLFQLEKKNHAENMKKIITAF